jgi:REP element-mobilizing transposase RayT
MGQTLTNLLTHIIFSTKGRQPLITTECKPDLMAYLGGIVGELNGKPLIINGTSDHVHLLIQLPPTLTVADCLRIVKTNSSRWFHQRWSSQKRFNWQGGYGAFSVSRSNAQKVIAYIENQEKHHQKKTFQEEYIALLKRHDLDYDERYIWA